MTIGEVWDYENKSHLNQFVMEAKKNPEKDVHRMRGVFFQLGLGISIALVITAFEWRTEVKKVNLRITGAEPELQLIIPITDIKTPEPALPSPIKNEIAVPKYISPDQIKETDPSTENKEEDRNTTFDPSLISVAPYAPVDDIPEDSEIPFSIVENPAQPIGGYVAFYKMLSKELKYPLKAQRFEVEGRVFIEFIVNRDGTPTDLKVARGIGYGCDEEAMRVVGLSRWSPGKQRGKPVRVKMVLPVVFKLQLN